MSFTETRGTVVGAVVARVDVVVEAIAFKASSLLHYTLTRFFSSNKNKFFKIYIHGGEELLETSKEGSWKDGCCCC